MTRRLVVVLLNTDPRNVEELAAPFYYAAVAAAMDHEVDVLCTATAGKLLFKGVADKLHVKPGDPKTGAAGVTSVEEAISFANTNNLIGSGTGQGNVVFIAGATDGYLLVDADNSGTFGTGDYGIVLDHLNNINLFGTADLI